MERVKITAADRQTASAMPTAGRSLLGKDTSVDPNSLFAALRSMRMELSRIHHLPPYIVCTDKSLIDMAAKRPHTDAALLQVYGMGDTKVERYGRDFLQCITDWESTHGGTGMVREAPVNRSRKPTSDRASSGFKWTKDEAERLRRGYLANLTVEQLAAVHNQPQDAIRAQLKKMGLIFNPVKIESYGFSVYDPEEEDDE